MNALSLRLAPVLAMLVLAGCANVKLDATGATPATVEKLRSAQLAPAQAGSFRLAPGKDPAMDTSLSGLRGNSLAPAKGSWSQLLKDTVVAELTAAGLYDPASSLVIEGQLTDSKVDAAIGTGTGRLAARFTVKKAGKVAYDKELAVDAQWESSFVGAVAIPAAMNQYGALYKALVAQLVDDPEFRRALTR
ncbi:MAG: hypothetical protein AB7S86_16170 [Hydrogenophaga sp.]|uniref:hypothetical protein n=1 Tax=Hydrogenophaga sp. TaxID=1904254 RepID=UPI003D0C191F